MRLWRMCSSSYCSAHESLRLSFFHGKGVLRVNVPFAGKFAERDLLMAFLRQEVLNRRSDVRFIHILALWLHGQSGIESKTAWTKSESKEESRARNGTDQVRKQHENTMVCRAGWVGSVH